MKTNPRSARRGFTLVEMLVAVTILGILSAVLMRTFIQVLNIYYYDTAKLQINRDIRTFTGAMSENATYANYFKIFPAYGNLTRTSPTLVNSSDPDQGYTTALTDNSVGDGASGDCLVLVYKDTTNDTLINRIIVYFRVPGPNDSSGNPTPGPVRVLDLPVTPSSNLPLWQLIPNISNPSIYPIVVQLSEDVPSGKLFYNFHNRAIIVKGNIIQRGGQTNSVHATATDTYNFTVSPEDNSMKTTLLSSHPQRGSALVTVSMISLGLMIVLASVLGYSLNERRMNYREGMRLEARNAAEAVSEYGLAQVRQLMQSVSDFSSNRFTSNEGAIALPPATSTNNFWRPGNVTYSGSSAPEIIIGLVSPVVQGNTTSLYYYNPNDPDNATDPLKGCYAFRFDIKVISKATVTPPAGGAGSPQTCYMTQTLSSRASPLFSYAVFYNMDMEISPGPTMNIIGAVHANGSLYARKNSSNGAALNFIGPVSVSGGIYANIAKYPTTNADGTLDDMLSGSDNVFYTTAAGGLVGMKSSSGVWQDQMWGGTTETANTEASFRTWSSQTYGGNLQSSVHGIQPSNPSGIPPYNPATASPGTPNYDAGNQARSFITPALMSSETGNHTMDSGYDTNIEAQKYSKKSGLYIVVNPSGVTRVGRMPNGAITNSDASSFTVGPGKYRCFDKDGNEIVLPGQPDYGINNATSNTGHTNYNSGNAIITVRTSEMTDMRRANFDFQSARSNSNWYAPKIIDTIDFDITELKKSVDRTVNGLSLSTVYTTTAPTTSNWSHFIYNPSATTTNVTITDANLMTDTSQNAAGGWNGGVYIYSIDADQQPLLSDNVTANSLYRGITDPSGVRLINGRGHVASATSATSTRELGLTVTTNDALYVFGNYNADGSVVTTTSGTTNDGLSNSGRYYETGEQPCSIASDATTILSAPTYASSSNIITQTGGWNDGLSMLRMSTSNWISGWRTTAPSSSNQIDGDSYGPTGTGYTTGSGYTSTPTVSLTGGGASTAATVVATVSPGTVSSFTITNGGGGYGSVPSVTFSGGGATTNATATATISSGSLTGFTITNPGAGYTSAPTITFSGGSPSTTAAATATIGAITSFTVTNAGVGYTSIPTIAITGGGGAGATAYAWLNNGTISSVTIGTAATISFSGGGTPTTAATAAVAMIVNGQITDVLPSAGVGYTVAPTIAFSGGGGTGATAVAEVAGGKVIRIITNNTGSGYTSAPTVTLTGGGAGVTTAATAVATVTGGKISEINLVSGAGYSSAPALTIAATNCTSQAIGITTGLTSSGGKVNAVNLNNAIPYVLPYARESGLQATSTARDSKFGGATTEISTAILTGLVVSNKNGVHQAAGGVHNFPRFSESWGSSTCAIRGSLVAMYESRVATEPFSLRVYGPPNRLWGFNELFNQGKFPPLTPTAMSYRRIDFNDTTAAQYTAAKTSFGL